MESNLGNIIVEIVIRWKFGMLGHQPVGSILFLSINSFWLEERFLYNIFFIPLSFFLCKFNYIHLVGMWCVWVCVREKEGWGDFVWLWYHVPSILSKLQKIDPPPISLSPSPLSYLSISCSFDPLRLSFNFPLFCYPNFCSLFSPSLSFRLAGFIFPFFLSSVFYCPNIHLSNVHSRGLSFKCQSHPFEFECFDFIKNCVWIWLVLNFIFILCMWKWKVYFLCENEKGYIS